MFLIIRALFQLLVVGSAVNAAEAMVNSAPGAPVRFRDGLRDYWRYYLPIGLVSALGVAAPRLPAWGSAIVVVGFIVAIAYMAYLWYDAGSRFGEGVCFTVFGVLMLTSMGGPLAMAGASLNGWFWLALLAFVWGIYLFRRFLPGRLWLQRITAILTGGVAAILAVAMLFGMVGDTIDNARAAAATRAAVAAQAEEQDEPDQAGAEEAAESGGIGDWLAGLFGRNSEPDDEAALQSAEPDGEDAAQTPDGAAVQNADADATSPYNSGAAGTPPAADAAAAEPDPAPVTSAVPSDADLGLGGADGLKVEAPEWVHFYNLDLDSDGVEGLNFGPNPYTSDSITVDDLDREFRTRAYCDVNFGTAVMAYCDSIFGTRYLGVFYSAAKEDWPTAINAARDTFMNDSELYRETLKQFFRYLNAASVTKRWVPAKSLTDMMYQNPFTITGVPDIIVLDSDIQEDSLVLTYSRPIKGGSRVDANFRVGCGFQPTNVAALMNITPTTRTAVYTAAGKSTPVVKTSTPAPTTPAASTSGSGSRPSSSSSSSSGAKDPSKGTPAGTNKGGSGSGQNTNSGSGSRTSAADKPTNTTSGLTSQPAASANKPVSNGGQKTGNDSAAVPSTAVPGVAVKNNGETGNTRDGSAPIRTETPVTTPATTGGAPVSNSGSSGGANGHAELPED